jgi:hypothetical protein
MELIHALKEWDITVQALEQGKTILLLRKGGIHEQSGHFTLKHRSVLLYPTYEHQRPELLQASYRDQVQVVPVGWHPTQVKIGSWAEITHILQINDLAQLTALLPWQIGTAEFAQERFAWKPQQPLYALLLQVSCLGQPLEIPYHSTYGGCKSWIDLKQAIATDNSLPVFSDTDYNQQVTGILKVLSTVG